MKKLFSGILCSGLLMASSLARSAGDEFVEKKRKFIELQKKKSEMEIDLFSRLRPKKEQWEDYEDLKDLCCKAKREHDKAKDRRYREMDILLSEYEKDVLESEERVEKDLSKIKQAKRQVFWGNVKKYSGIGMGLGLVCYGLWQFFKR